MPLYPGALDLLQAPAAPTVVQNSTGAGAAISYAIVPVSITGLDGPPSPAVSTPANNNATPNNTVSWVDVPGAAQYRVLKNGNLLATVAAGVTSYTDSAGSAGIAYTAASTAPALPQPVASTPLDGQKPTYRYAIQATAPYATPTDWIVIRGSATKTIRITHVELSGAATAATEVIAALKKHTIADTSGTSTNPTPTPHDTLNPTATASIFLYTVAPTVDASAVMFTPVRLTLAVAPAATTNNPDRFVMDYGRLGQAPVLRGVAQEFALNFGGAAVPSGGVYDVVIEWEEE